MQFFQYHSRAYNRDLKTEKKAFWAENVDHTYYKCIVNATLEFFKKTLITK